MGLRIAARSTLQGLVALFAGSLGVVGITACGAATPRLDQGIYRSGDVAFRIGEPPAGWRPIQVEHATLAWRDDANRASVLLDARCRQKDDDVPLVALTGHLMMGTTQREIASQDTIPLDAREALHSRIRARLDGVPMEYDVFVLKKDGCVYDFVYVAPPGPVGGRVEAGGSAFERFVSGFRTLGEGGAGGS